MKRIGFMSAAFIAALLFTSSLHAQDYKTAIGIRISSQAATVNNSITLKHFFSGSIAAEALVSFGDPFAIGVLVEDHKPVVNALTWFWGAGAYIGFNKDNNFGLQGGVGLDYKLPALPINLSVDWKPELNLAQKFSFEPAAVALSARFVLN